MILTAVIDYLLGELAMARDADGTRLADALFHFIAIISTYRCPSSLGDSQTCQRVCMMLPAPHPDGSGARQCIMRHHARRSLTMQNSQAEAAPPFFVDSN